MPTIAADPAADLAAIPALWPQRVAAPGGPLPGATLGAARRHRGALEYRLDLGARQDLATVVRARSRVTRLFGLRPEQLVVEAHPAGPAAARLLLLTDDSPLYHPLTHPGPTAFDAATGVVTIGAYADGDPVQWPLWTGHAALPGTVIGPDGSGAVDVLLSLLTAVAGSSWRVDARAVDLAGVNGLAAPGVPTAVTYDDAADVLAEATARIAAGAGGPAATDRPVLLLVLSDVHLLLRQPRLRESIITVAAGGPPAGVAVVTHAPRLGPAARGTNPPAPRAGNRAVLGAVDRVLAAALDVPAAAGAPALPLRWHNGQPAAGVGYTNTRNAAFRAYRAPVDW